MSRTKTIRWDREAVGDESVCEVAGCAQVVRRFGLCWRDYMALSEADRFWRQVVETGNGCWEWRGYTANGYGRYQFRRVEVPAHRWAYEHLVGDVPEGLELDHTCVNPPCVNPYHLNPVTHAVNCLERDARRTTCAKGHPYEGYNIMRQANGTGRCRTCFNTYMRERRAAAKRAG